jgi:hypothetical protein
VYGTVRSVVYDNQGHERARDSMWADLNVVGNAYGI